MEKNEGLNTEINSPGEGGFHSAAASNRPEKSSSTQNREFGSDWDHNLSDSEECYEQARKTVSDTFNKAGETLNKTYNQAIAYGRANPGKLALLALGSGLVIGLLLSNRNKARRSSYVEPAVNALS